MIRCLVFDFDGLILDTEGPEFATWQDLYREWGCELDFAVWSACIGTSANAFDPIAHLEELAGESVDRTELRSRHRRLFLERVARQPVLPGVIECLRDARTHGMRLGVASSSSREWVVGNLQRLGLLGHFDAVRTRTDVAHAKPAPDLYLSAVEELGVLACETLAFEDSPNGIRAAKEAGLQCVAVPNPLTCALPLEQADLVIESLAAIPLARVLALLGQNAPPPPAR